MDKETLTLVLFGLGMIFSVVAYLLKRDIQRSDTDRTELWRQFNLLKDDYYKHGVNYDRLKEIMQPIHADLTEIKQAVGRRFVPGSD